MAEKGAVYKVKDYWPIIAFCITTVCATSYGYASQNFRIAQVEKNQEEFKQVLKELNGHMANIDIQIARFLERQETKK